jgi:hypothetical protein
MASQANAAREVPARSGAPAHISAARVAFWVALPAAGLVQTWFHRHLIFSDGISYLEIAGNYARGDWSRALNDYWSPLYSWVLALALKLFHPAPYWQAATLHAVNFIAFCGSLAAFELFLTELIAFQRRASFDAVSERTLRIAGYSVLMWAGLHLIDIGTCSPDMIAMALLFLISWLLLRIDKGAAGSSTYALFGLLLGLVYLARSAFLPVAALYLCVVWAMLRRRGTKPLRPAVWVASAALLVTAPFVTALSIARGHFTLGTAGRLNYAWEICGAARSIHWQGEPYDIGVPKHPTRKVSSDPPAYTFTDNVPGSYPLWYEPSYWYAGIAPHFELVPQLKVLAGSARFLLYLFLLSPVVPPSFLWISVSGRRQWLSRHGIRAYWFLLLPMLVYIGLYCLVFLDRRYIAGSLAIVWVCLLASLPGGQLRSPLPLNAFNRSVQALSILSCLVFAGVKLAGPARLAWADLIHGRESEWNLEAMMAEQFRHFGVRAGDRIAYIGETINADWPRLLGARIVAEVPVLWVRYGNLNRFVTPDPTPVREFWRAPTGVRARILDAFRRAGAAIVVADKVPPTAAREGWEPVFPPGTPHLPWSKGQIPDYKTSAFLRLTPAPKNAAGALDGNTATGCMFSTCRSRWAFRCCISGFPRIRWPHAWRSSSAPGRRSPPCFPGDSSRCLSCD